MMTSPVPSRSPLPRSSAWLLGSLFVGAAFGVGVLACGSDAATTPSDTGKSSSTSDASPTEPSEAAGDASVTPSADAKDCAAKLVAGADRACKVTVGGKSRDYLLYAPAKYDPSKPAALVVDAHGASETAREHAGFEPFRDWPAGLGSGWRLVADREGFLVAQPQGIGNQWEPSDAAFMIAIAAEVSKVASVDPKRVYMTGISNGGGLTYWTGCKDTTVFRGFAPISGYGPQSAESCPLTHPAPLIHFHSAKDAVISMASGQSAFDVWVKNNHCKSGPASTLRFGGAQSNTGDVCLANGPQKDSWKLAPCEASSPETTCKTWSQCDGGVDATFCDVAPDQENHFTTTGGHILYINGTKLSLAAVAWAYLDKAR